ncbi:carbohydrate porin [Acetobacter sp. AN02]|uniref:carbohydrate porin n=1 Tax=Acetobacter sp. AN02 TaxID=2894186 RepID=UPI0024344775|nr:carbohydrate porin [Acetobacter sp. AN02]MDG6094050.1 carbohydrate porin [Acetobacter sp. AN02]
MTVLSLKRCFEAFFPGRNFRAARRGFSAAVMAGSVWASVFLCTAARAEESPSDASPEQVAEVPQRTIGPMQQAIPGFLQSTVGPPSFGPPYGTTHLLGDWGGAQPWLQNHGVYLALNVYESLSGNPSGGKRQTQTIAGQVGSTLDIDWQKLLGAGDWAKDFWLHMLVVNGHGNNLSRLMGDNGNQVQQIYGARGNVVAHLVDAYFEKAWFGHKIDWATGWIPTGTFFNNSPWMCRFVNVWLCGNMTPTKYLRGGRDWPSGNLATIVRLMPTPQFYVMGGIFAVSPHNYNGGISGWSWAQSGLGKIASQGEVGWIPEFGKQHLIGHYKFGGLYDNSRYDDLYSDVNGNPWVVTGLPARRQSGQTSLWAIADQMLIRNGPGDLNGLVLLAGWSYASGQTSQMRNHVQGGFTQSGALWHRPDDNIGFMYQWAQFSRAAIRSQQAAQAYGLPLPGANFGVPYGVQGHQEIYEAYYAAGIVNGLSVQPDFQYVHHLGGTNVFKDAVVLTLVVSASL